MKMEQEWAKLWMDSVNMVEWSSFRKVDDLFALVSIIKVGLVNLLSNHVTDAHVPIKKYSNDSSKLFNMLCSILKCIEVCP